MFLTSLMLLVSLSSTRKNFAGRGGPRGQCRRSTSSTAAAPAAPRTARRNTPARGAGHHVAKLRSAARSAR